MNRPNRRLAAILALMCAPILLGGCATMARVLKGFEVKAAPEDLKQPPESKLPLSIAIVVADPPGTRTLEVVDQTENDGKPVHSEFDRTSMYHGQPGAPICRELAKVAEPTFNQVFRQVAVFRQMPAPSEYDAVVRIGLSEVRILQNQHITSGMTFKLRNDVSLAFAWNVSVVDGKGVEILAKKGVTAPGGWFEVVMPPQDTYLGRYMDGVGDGAGKMTGALARDLALSLSSSDALKALAGKKTR